MRVSVVLPLGILLLSTLGAEAQVKNCQYPPFRTAAGQTVDLAMVVRSGKPCRITLGGSLGPIAQARIIKTASVGKSSAEGTSVTYLAKAGFAGADRFIWAWAGQDRWGKDELWSVDVSVKIIP